MIDPDKLVLPSKSHSHRLLLKPTVSVTKTTISCGGPATCGHFYSCVPFMSLPPPDSLTPSSTPTVGSHKRWLPHTQNNHRLPSKQCEEGMHTLNDLLK